MIEIFIISFLVALTGALSPGPVLTFTIYKSLNNVNGYLAGFFIVLGHATLEFTLIILLLAGASFLFQNLIILILLGLIGGWGLITFGILSINSVYKKQYEINFTSSNKEIKSFRGNSFIGGIFYSITNPFWTFWWALTGFSLMINLNISFKNPFSILLFFLGHEFGDFIWYVPISIFVYFGGKSLNPKVYKYILIGSGIFMVIFGIYLSLNILISSPKF
jgi:threonine/homoserine/homoserine lactone efflux protein